MAASLGATPSSAAYYDYNTTVSEDLTTLTTTHSPEFYTWTSATEYLNRYYIWIIFAFGFPGNMFCVFVIIRMSKRHVSTSLLYVAFLAIIDTLAIMLKLLKNQAYYRTIVLNETSCQLLIMFGASISSYANWVLIVMAAERFTAVRFPMKVSLIWTVRKAIIIMFAVFIVMVLIHVHILFTITHHEHYMCRFKKEFDLIRSNWYYVSSAVYAIIPAVILIIFNVLINRILRRSAKQRKHMLSARNAVVEAQHRERQITIMLVTVTVVFVVLTLPSCIYVLLYDQWKPHDDLERAKQKFVGQITTSLAHTNHAVNFYMYFMSGQAFREKSLSFVECPSKSHSSNSRAAETFL